MEEPSSNNYSGSTQILRRCCVRVNHHSSTSSQQPRPRRQNWQTKPVHTFDSRSMREIAADHLLGVSF